jgi:hypothetical protein
MNVLEKLWHHDSATLAPCPQAAGAAKSRCRNRATRGLKDIAGPGSRGQECRPISAAKKRAAAATHQKAASCTLTFPGVPPLCGRPLSFSAALIFAYVLDVLCRSAWHAQRAAIIAQLAAFTSGQHVRPVPCSFLVG